MSLTAEAEIIRQMLEEGKLVRTDADGRQREPYGTCPSDGSDGRIHRVTRTGGKVTEITFRCSACGQDFVAGPELMHLR